MNQQSARPNPTPPAMTVGVPGWIRTNLFSSPTDGIITIALGCVVAIAITQSINWVFFTASWEAVTTRIPLYVIGRYPQELYWRPETALLLVSIMLGMAWRLWGGIARGFAIAIIIVTILAEHFHTSALTSELQDTTPPYLQIPQLHRQEKKTATSPTPFAKTQSTKKTSQTSPALHTSQELSTVTKTVPTTTASPSPTR